MAKQIASLVVAVPVPPDHLAQTLRPLHYPLADADGFREYLQKAWPKSPPTYHIRLPSAGSKATLTAIRDSVGELAAHGPFAVFVVYLAGHGFFDGSDEAWFLTEGLAARERGIDASELDRLLAQVPASTTLLFLDCCHAARIVEGSRFFSTLPSTALSRLFVCSSQAGQLTWEDENYGHGLFSAVLLEALRTGAPSSSRAGLFGPASSVDIDGELFPYLCSQVPLVVERLKGRAQEPVKGGVSRWTVHLPTGDALATTAGQTVLGTVFHRLKRIAVALGLAVVAVVLAAEYLLHYVSIDEAGQITVQRGVRPLAWLVPKNLATRVQSDYSEQDLNPGADRLGALRAGSIVGVWNHQGPTGTRQWIDSIMPALKEPVRIRCALELDGRLPDSALIGTRGPFEGWRAELIAQSLLFDPDGSAERAARLSSTIPQLAAVDAKTSVISATKLDFEVLKLTTKDVLAIQSALITWAVADPDSVFPRFIDLARITCYRAAHNVDEYDTHAERQGLTEVLKALGAAMAVRDSATLDGALPAKLIEEALRLHRYGTGRGTWVLAPAAALGPLCDQRLIQKRLLSDVKTYNPALQGSVLRDSEEHALEGLAYSTAGRHVDPEVFSLLLKYCEGNPEPLLGVPAIERFLLRVAAIQPFPREIRTVLWRYVRAAQDPLDSRSLAALRILTAGALHLPPNERDQVVRDATAIRPFAGRMKLVAEIYGWLGAHGLATDKMYESLKAALRHGRRLGAPVDGEILADVVVGNDDEPAGLAIAQAMRERSLPERMSVRLYEWAEDRATEHTLDAIAAGLAAQRDRVTAAVDLATIRACIGACSRNVARRSLEVQIAIRRLLMLPREGRIEVLADVQRALFAEQEPEIRQALARVWIGTRKKMDLKDSGLLGSQEFLQMD